MIYIGIVLITFLVDQITKGLFFETIDGKVIINKFLSISSKRNSGAAYSMLADSPLARPLFIVLTVVFLGAIIFFYVKYRFNHPLLNVALALIVGGTLGNFADRIALKYVRDFILVENFTKLKLFNFINFYNNPADIFLCVGAVLLIVYIIFFAEKEGKTANNG